jgi:hypothetical protein
MRELLTIVALPTTVALYMHFRVGIARNCSNASPCTCRTHPRECKHITLSHPTKVQDSALPPRSLGFARFYFL